jgi:hypothetical protein
MTISTLKRLNVIPIHNKGKQCMVTWKQWQDKAITKELHERWKKNEFVNNNCAIITGKIFRGPYTGMYFNCIDLDNRAGIDELLSWFGEIKSLEELGQKTVVVQHEDAKGERAHIYFITEKPLSKKTGISGSGRDEKIPAIEVKSDNSTYVVCPPSIHQNEYPYQIIGTKQIQVLNEVKSRKLEDTLNKIYEKYSPGDYNPSKDNVGYLTKELRVMIKTLEIDDSNYKISNGISSKTLLPFADSLLYHHFNSKDIDYLKEFFFEVNQRLCETPLDEKEVEGIWNQAIKFIINKGLDKKTADEKERQKSKRENSQTNGENERKKEHRVFKYTSNNHIYESVIIAGKPFFVTIDDWELRLEDEIEQETRIIKPPYLEEYPSKPYEFENREELEKFVGMVKGKNVSMDALFQKTNESVSKFVVHHKYILDYISSLILFSYFQDRFSTIPYTMFVSDGGSGKSTIGNVFEDWGIGASI